MGRAREGVGFKEVGVVSSRVQVLVFWSPKRKRQDWDPVIRKTSDTITEESCSPSERLEQFHSMSPH